MATTMHCGMVTIAADDTREAVAGAAEVDWLKLTAHKENKSAIRHGDGTVTNSGAATDGTPLDPGKETDLGGCDLADVNVIGKEGQRVFYEGASTDGE